MSGAITADVMKKCVGLWTTKRLSQQKKEIEEDIKVDDDDVKGAKQMDAKIHIMHGTLATDGTNGTKNMNEFQPLMTFESPDL